MIDGEAEKAMAPHSSTLAWKIPWMEEPGGLPSMGLHRVGQDWGDLAAAAAAAAADGEEFFWQDFWKIRTDMKITVYHYPAENCWGTAYVLSISERVASSTVI